MFLKPSISKFFTTLVKYKLNVSATSRSLDIISSPSIKVILLLLKCFSEKRGLTAFKTFCYP